MSNMQINWVIGKKYRRRNGVISTMTGYFGHNLGREAINFDDGKSVWADHGKRYLSQEGPYDIIEEVKENAMKIEVGKWYKSTCGDKVHIIWEEEFKDCPNNAYYLDTKGNRYYKYEIDEFLIEEWKEPKSGVRYMNVYSNGEKIETFGLNESRQEANDRCSSKDYKRVACIRVEWKEGQFDD